MKRKIAVLSDIKGFLAQLSLYRRIVSHTLNNNLNISINADKGVSKR